MTRTVTGADGRRWTIAGQLAIDERGNAHKPCGKCNTLTMLGQLAPLRVPDGKRWISWDGRAKTPTGGRFGDTPDIRRAPIPAHKTVDACPTCRSAR